MAKTAKVPGMLWIAVSFLPWILYWVVSGLGDPAGIGLALLVSGGLTAAGFRRRRLYLMDGVSFCFFAAAAAVTYGFGNSVFVTKSGFLGYLALFFMAAGSVVAGKPFTFQVAKEDYPAVYWDDPAFRQTNVIISLVWAGIFFANAFLSRVGTLLAAAVYPNLLAVAGIVFSVFFPRWYPLYLLKKTFPRYGDWRVVLESEPPEPKSPELGPPEPELPEPAPPEPGFPDPGPKPPGGPSGDYDVIIVGAGIGGLSCGALLARRGLRVLVIEQHRKVGGYCTSFQRKGFVFDGGVEAVSGLGEKGPVRHLFRELGLDPEEFFIRTREEYVIGERRLKIPERAGDFIELLKREFPDEQQNIPRFFREVEKVYREIYQDVTLNGGTPLPPPLIYRVRGPQALLDYPKNHPHHYLWMQKSFQEVLDTYFQNRELKAFLSVLTAYLGAGAEDLNADAMAIIFGYYFDGGYYPRGGSQRLADTLAGVIGRHGGEIRTGCLVEKILLENCAVYGVAAGGKEYRSRIVVSNANAKNTFFSLVGKEHLPGWFTAYLKTLKESVSAFMVYLGVDMELAGYSPLLKVVRNGEGLGIVISSNLDPSLTPPGKASVSLITLFPAGTDFGLRGSKDYHRKKKAFSEKLISLANQVIPGLSRHIVVQDAATPQTFARYTLNPSGCIYGFDQSRSAPSRPYFKTPVKGLYLAGASTFPGGGIEAVVISGIIAANDITGWEAARKKN